MANERIGHRATFMLNQASRNFSGRAQDWARSGVGAFHGGHIPVSFAYATAMLYRSGIYRHFVNEGKAFSTPTDKVKKSV